jgi:hypothetical protein
MHRRSVIAAITHEPAFEFEDKLRDLIVDFRNRNCQHMAQQIMSARPFVRNHVGSNSYIGNGDQMPVAFGFLLERPGLGGYSR